MSGENEVSQRVKLDGSDYLANIRKLSSENKAAMSSMSKDMAKAGTAFEDYTNNVKKNSSDAGGFLDKFGKAFSANLGMGAAFGLMNQGFAAIAGQLGKSVDLALGFGKSFSMLAARADLSEKKIRDVRKALMDLAGTGADMDSLPNALNLVYGANGRDIDKGVSVMPDIAKVSGMTGMKPDQIAQFVVTRLQGENRSIDKGSVDQLLQALMVATRQGNFNNVGEAMESFGAMDSGAKKRLGISDRQGAALISSASQTGQTRERTVGAIQALTSLEDEGFAGNSVVRGLLGAPQKKKGEGFSFNDLGSMASGYKAKIKSGFKENQMISLLQAGGLSKDESEGLNAYLRDFDSKAKPAYQAAMGDNTSVDKMVETSTDNTSDLFKRTWNRVTMLPVRAADALSDPDSIPPEQKMAIRARERAMENIPHLSDVPTISQMSKNVHNNAPSWEDFKSAFMGGSKKSSTPAMTKQDHIDAVATGVAKGMKAVKVEVEITSKDPAYATKPKAGDKPVSAR